jgi:hypothetical protein
MRADSDNSGIPKEELLKDLYQAISFMKSTYGINSEKQLSGTTEVKHEITKL